MWSTEILIIITNITCAESMCNKPKEGIRLKMEVELTIPGGLDMTVLCYNLNSWGLLHRGQVREVRSQHRYDYKK